MMLIIALLTLASFAESAQTNKPFYAIAHMANSESAVRYAMRNGVNALEFDLWFDDDGTPSVVEHKGVCDCSCSRPDMCSYGLDNSCSGTSASNSPQHHLHKIAEHKNELALVIIDAKIDPKTSSGMNRAGRRIIQFVDDHLFGRGYRGEVIIGTGKIGAYEYIRSAVEQTRHSPNQSKYYFAFNQVGNDYHVPVAVLSQIGTDRRVYATGLSTCLPGNYEEGIQKSVRGLNDGEVGMSYIWTVDNEATMDQYIDLGVTGLMTNNPKRLVEIAKKRGLRMATPNDSIPISNKFVTRPDNNCDCDYYKGGCIISLPAPPNHSCQCNYKGVWTCTGSVIACEGHHNKLCKVPDGSLESCRIGGGDCGAYH